MCLDHKAHGIGIRRGRAFADSARITVIAAAAQRIGRDDRGKVAGTLAFAGIAQLRQEKRAGHDDFFLRTTD
jgi:hypothetical protein